MEDYYAKQAAGERSATRFLMYLWIAEMAWVSFFGMKALAHPDYCSLKTFAESRLFLSLNYIIPFWFLLQGLGLLVVGKTDAARAAFKDGIGKIVRWYKAAPTLTFIALGLLLWTAYNVSFRYHVTLEMRDQYPDDLAQVQTTRDSLTGDVTQRIFTEEQCYEAYDRDNSY
jgi:hypothetical protein